MLLPIITSVILVGIVSLGIIGLLWLRGRLPQKHLYLFMGLAAGSMLGDVFLHLLPEMAEEGNAQMIPYALAGIILFLILEKFLHWRHYQHEEGTAHHIHPVGYLTLIADTVHNLLDGVLIAAAWLVSPTAGAATTVAVILHEIPQEVGDFAILLRAGFSVKKAFIFNVLSGASALVGALATVWIGDKFTYALPYLVIIGAGGLLYIATTDLLPDLNRETNSRKSIAQIVAFLVGILLMVALLILE